MNQERDYINRLWSCTNIIDGLYYHSARILHVKDNTLTLFYALADGKVHSQKQICEEYLLPKTTLNTIVRECMENGYVALSRETHSREKNIILTEKGRLYAHTILDSLFLAEQHAMKRTLERFSPEFIDALEYFTANLQQEFENIQTESETRS
ncbi:MAG TPA: winged helix-turn-helix transcriptional regulator [Candidatus Merdisoma merdipullorum]|nr:winged helix-turn-helix transcriptional regulator [Candidatus Merdisoma merdipullorum]